MEKQELLKWIDENKIGRPSVFGLGTVETVYKDDLIEKINQFDEPQKVKVPRFVAEWFESNKHNLNFEIYELCEAGKVPVDLYEGLSAFEQWFYLNHDIETLIRMQDGYEVEEEPKYSVIVAGKYLIKMFHGRKDHKFVSQAELESWHSSAYKLTQKEIKEIDDRYWPFAVPVEKVQV